MLCLLNLVKLRTLSENMDSDCHRQTSKILELQESECREMVMNRGLCSNAIHIIITCSGVTRFLGTLGK